MGLAAAVIVLRSLLPSLPFPLCLRAVGRACGCVRRGPAVWKLGCKEVRQAAVSGREPGRCRRFLQNVAPGGMHVHLTRAACTLSNLTSAAG